MPVGGHLVLKWSAPHFIRDPEYCRDSTIRDAFSLTCCSNRSRPVIEAEVISVYIKDNFGELGSRVLDCFLQALERVLSGQHVFRMEMVMALHIKMQLWVVEDILSVRVYGSMSEWKMIRECFVWLDQAIGCPERGLAIRPRVAQVQESFGFSASGKEPLDRVLELDGLD